MKKSLLVVRYERILSLYHKISNRLNRSLMNGVSQRRRFRQLERLKAQLRSLEQHARLAGIALTAGLAICSSSAEAQTMVGSEFKANTFTTVNQLNSSIAMDSDGDFVVIWQSQNQDGNSYGIYGQRYNNAGVPQGTEFMVNTYTTNNQRNPSVAMDSDGDFVVVWESYDQDGSGDGVYGQRFDQSGAKVGSEFQINSYTTFGQNNPDVAMDSDGDFVVVWSSLNQDGSNVGVYGARYNNAGALQGGEFPINTYTTNYQGIPSVAMDSDGDFVVAWSSSGQDGDLFGVIAARYNNAGVLQGTEFQVNAYTTDYQGQASVAMDNDGDFVVAWSSVSQDGSSYGIYFQRYNNTGVAQGGQFQVNTYTTDYQVYPQVAIDASGDFVITYDSKGQDGSNYGIYARHYNALGTPMGNEFLVNTYTTGAQNGAFAAMDSDGDFVIAWASNSQDGDSYGVYAQRYAKMTAGVFSGQSAKAISLYPNPAHSTFQLESLSGPVSLRILDLSGHLVQEGQVQNQTFSVQGLPPGIYLVEINNEDQKFISKLVIE